MPRFGSTRKRLRFGTPSRKVFSKKKKQRISTIAKRVLQRNAEWKHHNAVVSGATAFAGGLNSLTDVAQGDTDLTRDGDQLTMGKLVFFLELAQSSGVGFDVHNAVRVILFQWFPQSAPAVSDILDQGTGTAPYYHYFTDKAKSFKILHDKIHRLQRDDPTAGGQVKIFKRRFKVRPGRKKIQYVSGGTTGSNKIYLLLMSDSSVTPHPTAYFHSRLNFMDV